MYLAGTVRVLCVFVKGGELEKVQIKLMEWQRKRQSDDARMQLSFFSELENM